MVTGPSPVVFDGHNDVLLRLASRHAGEPEAFFRQSEDGHIDLPRARLGGLGGGFCAVFVRSGADERPHTVDRTEIERVQREASSTPSLGHARRLAIELMALLFRVEDASAGAVKVITNAAQLECCLRDGVFAALLHMEGAEAIDPELNALEVFHRAGLRSLGPVWSRSNAFGHGVPFAFGQSPDIGAGLTSAGRELVRACNRLRIVIDLSHLNERGFWDVAAITDAPLVATHSNAHALSPSPRNLTDLQLAAIKESDGMVGVNFNVGFLRSDGASEPQTPLDAIVDHIDYLAEHLGIDRVGFGSDFDGALMPQQLRDAAALPVLFDALRRRGYDERALRKLAHENWVRVLRRTWGS